MIRGLPAAALLLAMLAGGCVTAERQVPPDERFGHRYAADTPEQREVVALTPPEPGAEYAEFSAIVSDVTVRTAPLAEAETVDDPEAFKLIYRQGMRRELFSEAGEVTIETSTDTLLTGRLQRRGHFIDVSLIMRRPQGAVCANARQPYRFYTILEGRYEPGDYIIELNGSRYPFSIRADDG